MRHITNFKLFENTENKIDSDYLINIYRDFKNKKYDSVDTFFRKKIKEELDLKYDHISAFINSISLPNNSISNKYLSRLLNIKFSDDQYLTNEEINKYLEDYIETIFAVRLKIDFKDLIDELRETCLDVKSTFDEIKDVANNKNDVDKDNMLKTLKKHVIYYQDKLKSIKNNIREIIVEEIKKEYEL